MVAPALSSIAAQFNVTDQVISQLMLSVFVLAYAVGPLFLGPLSEIYGRVIVLQLANLFFLVFNIGCAVSQTKVQMIVCRFFAGLGGSAPLAVSFISSLCDSSGQVQTERQVTNANCNRWEVVCYPIAFVQKNVAKASQSIVWPPFWAQPLAPSPEVSSQRTLPGDGSSMQPL